MAALTELQDVVHQNDLALHKALREKLLHFELPECTPQTITHGL